MAQRFDKREAEYWLRQDALNRPSIESNASPVLPIDDPLAWETVQPRRLDPELVAIAAERDNIVQSMPPTEDTVRLVNDLQRQYNRRLSELMEMIGRRPQAPVVPNRLMSVDEFEQGWRAMRDERDKQRIERDKQMASIQFNANAFELAMEPLRAMGPIQVSDETVRFDVLMGVGVPTQKKPKPPAEPLNVSPKRQYFED